MLVIQTWISDQCFTLSVLQIKIHTWANSVDTNARVDIRGATACFGSCHDDVGATPPENFGITPSQYMD